MRTPDPRYDLRSGEQYVPSRGVPLPRIGRLPRYRHTCPDGTVVVVSRQYVPLSRATLYRWRINGEPGPSSAVPGQAGEPDWTEIDTAHPLFLTEAAVTAACPDEQEIEMEPDCYVCHDAGCAWCAPGVDTEPDELLAPEPDFPPVPVPVMPAGGR